MPIQARALHIRATCLLHRLLGSRIRPRADGKAAILGMVLGYEILCGLTDNGAMQQGPHGPTWDQATYGLISAAVLAARLDGPAKGTDGACHKPGGVGPTCPWGRYALVRFPTGRVVP